jgi:hypothetical protein
MLTLVTAGSSGCSTIFHELQLHRLQRLNRGDELGGGTDAYFSVSDPLPESEQANRLSDETVSR